MSTFKTIVVNASELQSHAELAGYNYHFIGDFSVTNTCIKSIQGINNYLIKFNIIIDNTIPIVLDAKFTNHKALSNPFYKNIYSWNYPHKDNPKDKKHHGISDHELYIIQLQSEEHGFMITNGSYKLLKSDTEIALRHRHATTGLALAWARPKEKKADKKADQPSKKNSDVMLNMYQLYLVSKSSEPINWKFDPVCPMVVTHIDSNIQVKLVQKHNGEEINLLESIQPKVININVTQKRYIPSSKPVSLKRKCVNAVDDLSKSQSLKRLKPVVPASLTKQIEQDDEELPELPDISSIDWDEENMQQFLQEVEEYHREQQQPASQHQQQPASQPSAEEQSPDLDDHEIQQQMIQEYIQSSIQSSQPEPELFQVDIEHEKEETVPYIELDTNLHINTYQQEFISYANNYANNYASTNEATNQEVPDLISLLKPIVEPQA